MPTWAKAILVTLALIALVAVVEKREKRISSESYERGKSEVTAKVNADAVKAEEQQRKIEADRHANQQKALNEAEKDKQQVMADGARLSDAVIRLRKRLADYERQVCGDSAAAVSGPPAPALGNVLIDLAERHRRLAAEADEARLAGLTCQRIYESLTGKLP